MPIGKRTKAAREGVDREKSYSIAEAVKLVKERAKAKFDETIEIAMPTDEDIAGKIEAGKEVEYWIIMGRYKINRVKS